MKTRYLAGQWLGVSLGLVGVFITLGATFDFKVGTLLGIMSAISWAIGTLLIKVWGLRFDIWVVNWKVDFNRSKQRAKLAKVN